MTDMKALREFAEPYYADKDIMHNMWHIELVQRAVEKRFLRRSGRGCRPGNIRRKP